MPDVYYETRYSRIEMAVLWPCAVRYSPSVPLSTVGCGSVIVGQFSADRRDDVVWSHWRLFEANLPLSSSPD